MKLHNNHIVLLLLICLAFTGCKEEKYEVTLKQDVLAELDVFENLILDFKAAAEKNATGTELQKHFNKNRLQYKKTEWAIEYFIPETARFMNGPALDELELEENREFPPHGFQVIEELIFPYEPANKKELLQEITMLLSHTRQVKKTFRCYNH